MRVLIYKRTHTGDPDENGVFGIQDCMGKVRNWKFDAVIGIGGKAPWKGHEGIKYKINWVGLAPKEIGSTQRGKIVAFKHFELYEEKGKNIADNFPHLFTHMYSRRKRFDMSLVLPKQVFEEVTAIFDSIRNCPQSKLYDVENLEIEDFDKLKGNCGCAQRLNHCVTY